MSIDRGTTISENQFDGIVIRPIRPSDAKRLATLMAEELHTRFARLGMGFLELLHRHMAESTFAVSLGAEIGGRVVGYACAVTSVRAFMLDFVIHKGLRAALLSMPRVLNPAALRVLTHGARYSHQGNKTDDPTAELISVVVSPEARGRGIAGRLVHGIGQELNRSGLSTMTIKTASTNTAAISLYQNMGCRFVRNEPFDEGVNLSVFIYSFRHDGDRLPLSR